MVGKVSAMVAISLLLGCGDDDNGANVTDAATPDARPFPDAQPTGTETDGGLDAGTGVTRLDPAALEPFVDPLPQPSMLLGYGENGTDGQLTIGMWEIHQTLHRDLPPTRVWAYGQTAGMATYPGPTIETRTGIATSITWENHLPANHFLPVDTTIHWAAPPDWPGAGVPTVVHVHGGLQEAASDGHPDAWFTPDFAQTGPAFVKPTYHYANDNESETLWYHDHALGITRLNVYAGLAGFYLLRDVAQDAALGLPAGNYEKLLLLQDRAFNTDGSLYYPDVGDNPDVHPQWVPEFFGDVNLVNGVIWPYLEVEPRKYRFRLLNGANARFYRLRLSDGRSFTQIGTDGGYLAAPVQVDTLLLGPGERADVVIDFSDLSPGVALTLSNDAPAPFPGGDPVTKFTAQVMQLRVVEPKVADLSVVPDSLGQVPALGAPDTTRTLTLYEKEDPDTGQPLGVFLDGKRWGPPGSVSELPVVGSAEVWELVNLTDDAHPIHLHLIDFQILDRQSFDADGYRTDYEQANPVLPTPDAMPLPVAAYLQGTPTGPAPSEAGWKDTVVAPPGTVTRLVVRWAPDGGGTFPFDPTAAPGYVWHCHILEHEDNEMMRRFQLVAP